MDCAYLRRWTAMSCALDVTATVVGELDSVRGLVQEDRSLQIQRLAHCAGKEREEMELIIGTSIGLN